jgi:putative NADH-flavin reductase
MAPVTSRLSRWLGPLACLLLLAACAGPQVRLPTSDITAASRPASRDLTIALLGGTGMAGGYILREALASGYSLRVLSRSPEKLAYLGERITVVGGDARDPSVIGKLLAGSDVVISAIGPSGAAPQKLSTTVTGNILAAMDRQGLERYIVVSGGGVAVPGDDRNFTGWLIRQLVRLRYPSILADKQAEYALLAASDVDWTLVRCPLIESNDYQRTPHASLDSPSSFILRAGELARFIIGQIEKPDYVQQAPFLESR